jgi:GntR family transcriptional regulator/MocR family aminotransferase
MPKRATSLSLALGSQDPDTPAYLWLSNALRAEILEGRLLPGSRLPATRELARQCGISRGTIVTAFDQLKSEGYVEGTTGSGTYVNRVLPDDLLQVHRRDSNLFSAAKPERRTLSNQAVRVRPFPDTGFRHVREQGAAGRSPSGSSKGFPPFFCSKAGAAHLIESSGPRTSLS